MDGWMDVHGCNFHRLAHKFVPFVHWKKVLIQNLINLTYYRPKDAANQQRKDVFLASHADKKTPDSFHSTCLNFCKVTEPKWKPKKCPFCATQQSPDEIFRLIQSSSGSWQPTPLWLESRHNTELRSNTAQGPRKQIVRLVLSRRCSKVYATTATVGDDHCLKWYLCTLSECVLNRRHIREKCYFQTGFNKSHLPLN